MTKKQQKKAKKRAKKGVKKAKKRLAAADLDGAAELLEESVATWPDAKVAAMLLTLHEARGDTRAGIRLLEGIVRGGAPAASVEWAEEQLPAWKGRIEAKEAAALEAARAAAEIATESQALEEARDEAVAAREAAEKAAEAERARQESLDAARTEVEGRRAVYGMAVGAGAAAGVIGLAFGVIFRLRASGASDRAQQCAAQAATSPLLCPKAVYDVHAADVDSANRATLMSWVVAGVGVATAATAVLLRPSPWVAPSPAGVSAGGLSVTGSF